MEHKRSGSFGSGLNRSGLGRGGRLPSFKGHRDLSLRETASGSNKAAATSSNSSSAASGRKFVPNLNVQRSKKDDGKANKPGGSTLAGKNSHAGKSSRYSSQEKQSWGGKQQSGQPAGGANDKSKFAHKGKHKPELIQTMGSVFGDGLGSDIAGIRRKGSGGASAGGRNDDRDVGVSPAVKRINSSKVKDEDERRLKALLRDDFIEDHAPEGFFVPVQLPMVDTGLAFKEEDDIDAQDEESTIKPSNLMLQKKKKNQVLDSDDDDDDEVSSERKNKPTTQISEKAEVSSKSKEAKEITFPDLVKSQKGDLLFIQMPDHLPSQVKKPSSNVVIKKEDGAPADANASISATPQELTDRVTLSDLPEGFLGKIQIHKSGKTKLCIGDTLFDLELGTRVGFLQDVVSIQTEAGNPQSVGDMTVLGHVSPAHRVVIAPDWTALLNRPLSPQSDTTSPSISSVSASCKKEQPS